jgi:hypothetical protein
MEPSASDRPSVRANPWGRRVIWPLAAILVLVIALEALPRLLYPHAPRAHMPFAEALPHAVSGWQVRRLAIADTPEMRQTVSGILQFDDAIVLEFSKPGGPRIEVYAAYWKAGKAPYSLVGVHTPDTCWVNNGWTCQSRGHARRMTLAGRALKPAEEGVYALRGSATEVLFWHLVGGRPNSDYGFAGWTGGLRGYIERFPLFFTNLRRYSMNLAQPQLFVRISSMTPFEELSGRPDFEQVMLALAPLDIFEPAPSE